MEITVPQFLMWVVGQIVVAAGIWGGIRADLKGMHERLNALNAAVQAAHARIDNHLENGGVNRRVRER